MAWCDVGDCVCQVICVVALDQYLYQLFQCKAASRVGTRMGYVGQEAKTAVDIVVVFVDTVV